MCISVLDVYVLIGMYRMTFSEFACLHGKDERFKAIEKKREREAIFTEYVSDLKRSCRQRDGQHKVSARSRTDEVCVVYTDSILLQNLCFFVLFVPSCMALTTSLFLYFLLTSLFHLFVSLFPSLSTPYFYILYLLYSAES